MLVTENLHLSFCFTFHFILGDLSAHNVILLHHISELSFANNVTDHVR